MSRHRTFSVEGGHRAAEERLARLAQPAKTPQRLRPLPPPDAAHYARLAADKRAEAAGLLRHVRPGDTSEYARFARRQAHELYAEADRYAAMAEGGAS